MVRPDVQVFDKPSPSIRIVHLRPDPFSVVLEPLLMGKPTAEQRAWLPWGHPVSWAAEFSVASPTHRTRLTQASAPTAHPCTQRILAHVLFRTLPSSSFLPSARPPLHFLPSLPAPYPSAGLPVSVETRGVGIRWALVRSRVGPI